VDEAVKSAPDVAVLGFGKDDSRQDCLEAVAGLRREMPDCPVAAFFDFHGRDVELGVKFLELGAAGFISRRCSGAQFVTALRWLYYGGALIPRAMLDDVASALAERRLEVQRTIRLEEPTPEPAVRPNSPPPEGETD
jgi:DNA-binding NarL/FixJ family response regulator